MIFYLSNYLPVALKPTIVVTRTDPPVCLVSKGTFITAIAARLFACVVSLRVLGLRSSQAPISLLKNSHLSLAQLSPKITFNHRPNSL